MRRGEGVELKLEPTPSEEQIKLPSGCGTGRQYTHILGRLSEWRVCQRQGTESQVNSNEPLGKSPGVSFSPNVKRDFFDPNFIIKNGAQHSGRRKPQPPEAYTSETAFVLLTALAPVLFYSILVTKFVFSHFCLGKVSLSFRFYGTFIQQFKISIMGLPHASPRHFLAFSGSCF